MKDFQYMLKDKDGHEYKDIFELVRSEVKKELAKQIEPLAQKARTDKINLNSVTIPPIIKESHCVKCGAPFTVRVEGADTCPDCVLPSLSADSPFITLRDNILADTQAYLLSHETDVAWGIDDFGCLINVFKKFFNREPKKDPIV